jgi:hypothetical protein
MVIEWAVVFGRTRQHLMKNISRARETWEGMETDRGERCRWFVPARKAARIHLEGSPASVWINGSRRPALYVELPPETVEEVEWLRIDGERIESFEQIDDRVVMAVNEEALETGGAIGIEGQLTDGTLFTASVEADAIIKLSGEGVSESKRLPEECLDLFPNPFVTDLNIKVNITELSELSAGRPVSSGAGAGSVKVYDVKGRLVRTILEEETLHPGDYSLGWDGMDEYGTEVSPGVYYCKLQIGEKSLTKRVILLR